MVRIVKGPEIRRAEILDAAEALFVAQGYHETSINDIVGKVAVAKGTFYYYFKTKEEILEAIVQRLANAIIDEVSAISDDPGLPALDKMERMLRAEFRKTLEKYELVANLHEIPNADMHQKMLVTLIREYTPIMVKVIEQGTREGTFKAHFPRETSEIVQMALRLLFDPSLFPRSLEENRDKVPRVIAIIEHLLGTATGALKPFGDTFSEWVLDDDCQGGKGCL